MSLADFEGMALGNNPVIARATARVEAARGAWVQAGLPPNPTAGYVASEIGQDDRAGQQGAFAGQEIVTAGKLRLNRAVADQEIRIAEQQLAAQKFRVLTDVRIAFFEALGAQRRAEVADDLIKTGRETINLLEQQLKAMEGSRVDLLQARVEANTIRIVVENARNDYIAAWRRLAALAGAPDMQPAALTGDIQAGLTEIHFEEALPRLLSTSPEMAGAYANVARAEQALNRARAERVPNLDLQASVQHDNSTSYDIAGAQVGFPIPLVNRNQGGIRRAEAELSAAHANARRVQLELQYRLASTFQRYVNAKQQVDAYTKEILPDSRGALILVTQGHRQGEFGYLMLLTAQRTYFQTNLAYLESLQQLRESIVEIEGLLLRGSLQSVE